MIEKTKGANPGCSVFLFSVPEDVFVLSCVLFFWREGRDLLTLSPLAGVPFRATANLHFVVNAKSRNAGELLTTIAIYALSQASYCREDWTRFIKAHERSRMNFSIFYGQIEATLLPQPRTATDPYAGREDADRVLSRSFLVGVRQRHYDTMCYALAEEIRDFSRPANRKCFAIIRSLSFAP
jgi:hypothetical protein